jgi:hypothetical protein
MRGGGEESGLGWAEAGEGKRGCLPGPCGRAKLAEMAAAATTAAYRRGLGVVVAVEGPVCSTWPCALPAPRSTKPGADCSFCATMSECGGRGGGGYHGLTPNTHHMARGDYLQVAFSPHAPAQTTQRDAESSAVRE